ncbi:carbohydrate ABC transporter permease [Oscillochloris sp. ZM17-4]|uniref:carbohydrate ABC transporter permease n=1 Tax=Oscillochloris sp. ZM17-4 TaxID=2866714 RepID=UPI001C72A796|nr:carbohydrate ABC transporter permease [Oscillochloris sp. ZM17-4]MBX0329065.1 carbohydrate ABC transporter permease [Oscillochloris sp. ZM17-4]
MRSKLRRLSFHALAGGAAAIFTLPLLWAVVASLRPAGLPPPRTVAWLPDAVALSNYRDIFTLLPMARYLLNSLLVAAVAVPITVVVASWAGFAMALLPSPLRGWLVLLAVGLRLVPLTTLWLPRFLIFAKVGLTDTLWALVAPAWMGTSPFYVLLFYWSFRRLPSEVFDAARLDGAGALATWARVALPLAAPTAAAVSALSFVHYWSDFINPLLYLRSDRTYTLAVGLRALQQLDPTGMPLLLAGAVVMLLPVVALFLSLQRLFWLAEAPARAQGG